MSLRQSPPRTRMRNPPCKRASYWGRGGAGVMFTCEEDDTVLLLLRAEWVQQGGTWGIPGGGIGEGHFRTPMQPITDMRVFREKAEEEVREECGSLPPDTRTRRPMTSLPEGLAFTEYDDCGFRYVTFLCDLTREQKAAWKPYSADGENDAFVWFPLRAVKAGRPLPDEYGDEHDIHFGVSFTMENLPARTNPRRRNPDIDPRLLAADGARYFSPKALAEADEEGSGYKSRVALVLMRPQDFLDMAEPGKREESQAALERVISEGIGFAGVPRLFVDVDGDDPRIAHVTGHEGRHRSRALLARGVTQMPVRIHQQTIRWSEQSDPKARYYKAQLPERLFGEGENKRNAIPMPVPLYYPELGARMRPARSNPRRSATTAERTDPALWEAVKREVTAGTKGGIAGEWSARKAQLAVALYKKRGGGYVGPKSPSNSLAKWTREDWRTRSGEPSLVTGERYLPARAIAALTPAEYAATSRVKRAGLLRDEQFTRQPERIAAKTARYRKNPASFPEWFAGSVVVMPDGSPRTLWHQTSEDAEASILKEGFRLEKGGGRWTSSHRDTEMPYGVFLKTTPYEVTSGLPYGAQMALFVRSKTPLRVQNRDELLRWLYADPTYRDLREELDEARAEYRSHHDASLRKQQKEWSVWNKTFKRLAPLLRRASTDALRAAGHDALWMANDEGPSTLETLVVLDPENVRLASAPDMPIGKTKATKQRKNPSRREADAVRAIRANLTPDLLAGEYRACATQHPMAGHCSVATEALYFMLGGKAAGYTPMNVRHEVKGIKGGVSHWYLRTPEGAYLDPTADQFDTPVDYAAGRGRGFPTPKQGHAEPPPSRRAQTLLRRLGKGE